MLITACMVIFMFVAVAAFVYGVIKNSNAEKRKLKLARRAYQMSLEQLKEAPTSPDARQTALELGRLYSSLTRNFKRVTLFDEMALKNDIDAACAGADRR